MKKHIFIRDKKIAFEIVRIYTNKHITVSNLYIPPQDAASPEYATLDTYITKYIQQITNTQDSILTGNVNVYSTLQYSYTDDYRGT